MEIPWKSKADARVAVILMIASMIASALGAREKGGDGMRRDRQ